MASFGQAQARPSRTDGRGLYATDECEPGQLIFAIRPLLATLDLEHARDTCGNCFRSTQYELAADAQDASDQEGAIVAAFKIQKCGGCRVVSYCSKVCQTEHWKLCHKSACKMFKSANNGKFLEPDQMTDGTVVLAMLELVARRNISFLTESEWISVLQLKSHVSEMRNHLDPLRYNKAAACARAVAGILQALRQIAGYTEDFFIQLASAIITNSLTLVSPTCDPLGLILDPFACLTNHSCAPNAFVVMDGRELSFRALRDIGSGEEIFVSYIDETEKYHFRQKELSDRYFFNCRCARCKHGPDIPREQLRALSFEEHGVFEEIRKAHQRQMGSDECRKLETSEEIDEHIRKLLRASTHVKGYKRRELLRLILIQCRASGLYPPYRQPYAAARNEYILECLAIGDFETAFRHALKTYIYIDPMLYPNPFNPIRVVHTYRLAKLTNMLAHPDEPKGAVLREEFQSLNTQMSIFAMKCLADATENVKNSHGAESAFAKLVESNNASAIEPLKQLDEDAIRAIALEAKGLDDVLPKIADAMPW